MTQRTLLFRSLSFHWRMHAALLLCAVVGTATLTGALLVGDSMRGSLHEHALERLGPVSYAVRSPRSFREAMADAVGGAGVVMVRGAVEAAETQRRAGEVQILGVDDAFWRLWPGDDGQAAQVRAQLAGGDGRAVVLNASLARELGAKAGDDVLLRFTRQARVSMESVLGRPDEAAASARFTVAAIVPEEGIGGFSLEPAQGAILTAFVPRAALQRATDLRGRINCVLIADEPARDGEALASVERLADRLAKLVRLDDYGLSLRAFDAENYVALESDQLLIDPVVEAHARKAAETLGLPIGGVLSYLANDIAVIREGAEVGRRQRVPYSIVAAIDPTAASMVLQRAFPDGEAVEGDSALAGGWLTNELGLEAGETLRLTYYVTGGDGSLVETSHDFRVAPGSFEAADLVRHALLPAYEGITDAPTLADWNPPSQFRIDLKRITPADEAYWKAFRGAPKLFVPLDVGQALWAGHDPHHGRLTSLRIQQPENADGEGLGVIEKALLTEMRPERMGMSVESVREKAAAAGAGSTDFGMLFISFSFFLIVAAALLTALIFRLNVERRAVEVGLLLALGFSLARVRRQYLVEGAAIATIGGLLGLLGAMGYAWLMIAGLRTWWAGAVGAPFLTLHVGAVSLAVGFAASLLVAVGSIRLALRGVVNHSPRSLLAGVVASSSQVRMPQRGGRARLVLAAALIGGISAIVAGAVLKVLPIVIAFFAGGAMLLIAGLAGTALMLSRRPARTIQRGGRGALVRLGLRNARRRGGRSLATVAVIACAAFVIIAVGASRHGVDASSMARDGGTGGYALMATSAVPLPFDPATATGRENLGVSKEAAELIERSTIMPMRLKPGDDTSCLNLYQVTRPRIVGAPAPFIERGGFSFQASLAATADEKGNPWKLLEKPFDDGAIPAIGDANTLMWLLKVGLEEEVVVPDDSGSARHLRIVGMLSGSVLQSELVVSEDSFKRLFPWVAGDGFLMIDAPPEAADELADLLERELHRYGVDVTRSIERLARYRAVENTYMAVFQTLGGIGLVLGTIGLAAIMLRNILERRGEFGLMRALGFSRKRLRLMVLAENAALIAGGLLVGGGSALCAVLPRAIVSPGDVGWMSLGMTMAAVFVIGMMASIGALRAADRAPVLAALRRE